MAEWWKEVFTADRYTVLADLPDDHAAAQVDFALSRLGVAPGGRVLDVACGVGRHAVQLAGRGYRAVGFDYSMSFVEQAAATARASGGGSAGGATFVRADMRRPPFADGSFDAAVVLFNSFGYFERDADQSATLAGLHRLLRPGGGLVIDVLHRDAMARAFTPSRTEAMGGGTMTERRTWDALTGRLRSAWTFDRPGDGETFQTAARVFTAGEMARLLTAAGFEVVAAYGGWDGRALTIDTVPLILHARRPEGP